MKINNAINFNLISLLQFWFSFGSIWSHVGGFSLTLWIGNIYLTTMKYHFNKIMNNKIYDMHTYIFFNNSEYNHCRRNLWKNRYGSIWVVDWGSSKNKSSGVIMSWQITQPWLFIIELQVSAVDLSTTTAATVYQRSWALLPGGC